MKYDTNHSFDTSCVDFNLSPIISKGVSMLSKFLNEVVEKSQGDKILKN